jgi:hypothetical protein
MEVGETWRACCRDLLPLQPNHHKFSVASYSKLGTYGCCGIRTRGPFRGTTLKEPCYPGAAGEHLLMDISKLDSEKAEKAAKR